MTTISSIAVIGAGLSSLSLALALLRPSHTIVPASAIKIYEARSFSSYSHSPQNASGVLLTPNGLAVLDELGVLERITHKCWTSEYRVFKNRDGVTTRKVRVADEDTCGYKEHRIWRRVLPDGLVEMVVGMGVVIEYGSKFEGVLEESVIFQINGERLGAGLSVGADGIYSSVRSYLDPEVEPEYSGVFGVLGHIRYGEVDWPYGFGEKQFTLQDQPGAIFMMPEAKDGVEGVVGLQKQIENLSKNDWEAMSRDKERLCGFYRESFRDWGETARKIIDAVCRNQDRLYAWPFLKLPSLKRWSSEKGRVLLVGDSAHAIPPSSGQGVNQALEDVWTLTALLASGKDLPPTLDFWQKMRQRRIDEVVEQVLATANMQRLPEEERKKLLSEQKNPDAVESGAYNEMAWLYKPDSEKRIRRWIESQ